MANQDFVRQIDLHGFGRSPGLSMRWHIDFVLLGFLLLLCGAGLFILYSATGRDMSVVIRQATYLGISLTGMLIVAQIPPRVLMQWAKWFYVGGVLLLLAVLFMGVQSKGAQRWIQLPGFRFQPSEVIKLIMPITMAAFLARRPLPPLFKDVIFSLIIIAVPVVLIAKQPDLGTSILIGSSGLFVLLLAGLRKRMIFSAICLAAPAIYVFWQFFMYDYQKRRVLTFLNPESDPWGAGWNIIQSTIAIGSGGLYGKGWLQGTQSHLDFLPESHTDFIIAVLAEEFGLMGCLVLFVLYTLILGRGLFITLNAETLFGRLLAGSITLTFFVYIFVNIGMVSGLLPVVGVPLPMVSRGGTSLVTLLAGFGFLMSIHTHRSFLRASQ
ncbi:rod shape-determining protein RodA [Salinisphaera sp. G21_0]|uniref:rod shape-determining protein RodA n=2 Tax=Gammaproteobacteria TaxID=1236 RepID=UPI001ADB27D8|nr:rod shape-determining protein RodA [Salinisphaera sp. G21_0]MBO9492737.1 rod shape-determining protein RodA [Thalassotalea sp. G20_0]